MTSASLSSSELVIVACAPVLMVVVSLFERRWGPAVAGIVAAAPSTALIGLLLVHSDLGAEASHEMALRMGGYVPAQIGIAVVVVALVARTGFTSALMVGLVAYGFLASVSARLPAGLAVAASLVLLLAGTRLVGMPSQRDQNRPAREAEALTGAWMISVRALVTLLTAVGLLVVADQFGPAAGGAVGAFPVFTFTLCCFLYTSGGPLAVTQVLVGMVRGLPPYVAFVLTYAATGPHVGVIGATTAGTLFCACLYLVAAWRSSSRPDMTAGVSPAGGAEPPPGVHQPADRRVDTSAR